ncbi:MAG: hypothetical protein AB7T74_17065 [Clostridia bacterium]|jgi:hypothetical protein
MLTFLMPAGAQERVKAYHQLNLPGFSLEYWADFAGDPDAWLGLGYRHSLVSSFIGYSKQERLLERARWEVYLQFGFMHETGFSAFLPGAYTGLGWNLSFENPGSVHRNILIPYVGFELGVLTMTTNSGDRLNGSSAGASSVIGGIHLYSSPGFSCSLEMAILHVLNVYNPIKGRAGFFFSFIL